MPKTFEEIGKEATKAGRQFPNSYPLSESVTDLAAACEAMRAELLEVKRELAALKREQP